MNAFNTLKIFTDPAAVALAAADYIVELATACVDQKGQCHIVLPGGSTPAHCLQLLADRTLPWQAIHWYPSDERCYPRGHAERNDTMIRKCLFSKQHGADRNFHPIPAELGAEAGAEEYASQLEDIAGLDIVILGMGEDGHTASLFPGNVAVDDPRMAVPVFEAPKPPSDRISISLDALRSADQCLVLATGESKREALTRINEGEALPVSLVEPDTWFVDEAAMTGIRLPE